MSTPEDARGAGTRPRRAGPLRARRRRSTHARACPTRPCPPPFASRSRTVVPRPSSHTSISTWSRVVADAHFGVARGGVLDRVRQPLLHEPVSREVDAGRQRHRLAFDLEVDRRARRRRPGRRACRPGSGSAAAPAPGLRSDRGVLRRLVASRRAPRARSAPPRGGPRVPSPVRGGAADALPTSAPS